MKIKIEIDFDTREEIAMTATVYKLNNDGEYESISIYDFAYVSECAAFLNGYMSSINELLEE